MRHLLFALAAVIAFALAACGGDDAAEDGAGPSGDPPASPSSGTSSSSSSSSSGAPSDDGGTKPPAPSDAGDAAPAPPPKQIILDVPFVLQKPELPRGCEVTSLAMMLQKAGVPAAIADKMKLASEIDKVPYQQNGLYGNPNVGFVGDMYTFAKPGYGVYHAPVERLAEKHLPGKIVKLTGMAFDDVLGQHVGQGRPVWIVTNATFKKLPASSFTTWKTATGNVDITWEEHSVVITGYDPTSVYINNPLAAAKNQKLERVGFRDAWEQMGKQAITYAP